jgi:hypothetical protein
MGVLVNKAKYQGYPVQGLQFRRSPGTTPDFGWVDLAFEDFRDLAVKRAGLVPWKNAQFPAGNTIRTMTAGESSLPASRRTVALPGIGELGRNPTPGKGFFSVGDLVMTTSEDGSSRSSIVYEDVYIAPDGIEETLADLDQILKHDRGILRVPVTDIRNYWKYGVLAESLNVRLDGGNYDPATIKEGKPSKLSTTKGIPSSRATVALEPGAAAGPYSLTEILQFLLRELPGDLELDPRSEVFSLGLDPPENVIGEMTPAVQVLDQLLKQYSLELTLLPENRVSVQKKGPKVVQGEYFIAPGVKQSKPPLQTYEKKSITISDRPPLVMVTGQRRVREISVPYVPIYQDIDGKFYPLEDVEARWGFPFEELKRIIFNGHEKAFRNLPGGLDPRFFDTVQTRWRSRGEGQRYFEKIRILQKWAFRGYGPVYMFLGEGPNSSSRGITEKELQRLPFLPMMEFMERTGPNKDNFQLRPIQVRAYTIKQGFFTGRKRFDPGSERFDAAGLVAPPPIEAFEEMENAVREHIEQITRRDIPDIDEAFKSMKGEIESAKSGLLALALNGIDIELEREMAKQGTAVRVNLDFSGQGLYFDQQAIIVKTQDVAEANKRYNDLKRLLAEQNSKADALRSLLAEEKTRFDDIKTVYKRVGGLGGWINNPHGLVPQGDYVIDPETGILIFSDIAGAMKEPFAISREGIEIGEHAHPTVRFGHEYKSNSIFDWSTCIWQILEDETIAFVGFSRPTGIKPQIVRDNTLRIYEDENGKPLNHAVEAARSKSKAQAVVEPRLREGYVYEMAGFHRAVAISGEVQHLWDGDRANTLISVNAQNARMPLGNSKLKNQTIPLELVIQERNR